ncbi:MAG: MBOAT family protein [Oscillospiraceae bacterium]|nr:MBOAT family protein [Oscillospiraceae bacterium]
MLFTSFEFIVFLCVVFAAYYLIPKRFKQSLQWVVLFLASVFFYYLTGVNNLIYLGTTITTAYAASMAIGRLNNIQSEFIAANKAKPESERLSKDAVKAYKKANKNKRLILLTLCLLVNFGLLGFVKLSLFGVLGLSFYIFRSMSYLIDLHRGKFSQQKNPLKFALYVSFFPVLIQGPITRYEETGIALFRSNSFNKKEFSFGIQRIMWGFFKKLVIADRLVIALGALNAAPETYRGIYALMAFLFYAIVLYADFTGGIDITIGVGQALGIPMKENFIRPFYAKSIAEYWRRWHITMGEWFRDYLFYPLSTSKLMMRFGAGLRKVLGSRGNNIARRLPVHIATMVAWFSTGIWHGVSWNFIVWGLVNGVVIVLSLELEPLYKRFGKALPRLTQSKFWLCLQIVRTFWLMNFIRAFDLHRDVRTTLSLQLSVFTDFRWAKFMNEGVSKLGVSPTEYGVIAAAIALLFIASYIKNKTGGVREWLSAKPMPLRFTVYGVILFGTLIFGAYGLGFNANGFMYTVF